MRIAYQGEPGAFGEEAARMHGGNNPLLLPMHSFEDVVTAVMDGLVDQGVLPVANSIIGTVRAGAAAAATPGLTVLRSVVVQVEQCLLAKPGTAIETISRVYSHPAALDQCRNLFTAHPHMTPVEWYDTAGAAKHVAASDDVTIAAIASRRAAEHYGLQILDVGIQDQEDNATEFVVVRMDKLYLTQSLGGAEGRAF